MTLTRRGFIESAAAASVAAVVSLEPRSGLVTTGWVRHQPPLPGLPKLDGALLVDDSARAASSMDWGGGTARLPLAVLRPASVRDVARMVRYANDRALSIAMRGRGHCAYGQALVEGGIVIDSRTLNAVRLHEGMTLDAQAGAHWSEVVKAALTRGSTPPVLPDALVLSVGGTLGVGGTGETGCRSGAVVDHVLELEVVTGTGSVVTCSPERNAEVFQMTLGGMGQCALIVRARLRLERAPATVVMRRLNYLDVDSLLADQARLAMGGSPETIGGEVTRAPDGRWRFVLLAGSYGGEPNLSWLPGLQFQSVAVPVTSTWWEYVDRRTGSIAAATSARTTNPSLAGVLPEHSVAPFLNHVISTPAAFRGIGRIEVFPMLTARFTRPLHRLPSGPLVFTVRLQRRASAAGAEDHRAMLEANDELSARLQALGGRMYPPFAPILSRREWEAHYGEVWPRFAAAKRRFDPRQLLTPGAGIFPA